MNIKVRQPVSKRRITVNDSVEFESQGINEHSLDESIGQEFDSRHVEIQTVNNLKGRSSDYFKRD